MCEIGILVAAAIILDLPFIKFKLFANGGSISLCILPLFILCLRQRPFKGFLASGVIFGLIDCLMDGEPIYSIPLDYLVGYGSCCLVGLTNIVHKGDINYRKYVDCALLGLAATFIRLAAGTASGMIFYSVTFEESLILNMTYILPCGGISIVALLLLLKPLENIGNHK